MVVAPPPHFTLTIVLTRSTSYSSRPHFTTIYSEKYSAAEAEVSTILKFDPAMHYRVHTLYILYTLNTRSLQLRPWWSRLPTYLRCLVEIEARYTQPCTDILRA